MGTVNLFCDKAFSPIIHKLEIKEISVKNASAKKKSQIVVPEKISEKENIGIEAAVTVLSAGIIEILEQITLIIGNSVNASQSDRTHVTGIMSALFKIPIKYSEEFFRVIQNHIEQAYAIGSEVLPGYLVQTLT